MKRCDIKGLRFGSFVAQAEAGKNKHGHIMWRCLCDCGRIFDANTSSVKRNLTCGEGHAQKATHGHARIGAKTPTYRSWLAMNQRCMNPHAENYPLYGGRGITVCKRWESFAEFLADMGERPVGTSLDRIDGSLGYMPGNCRWATSTVQGRNTASVKVTPEIVRAIRASAHDAMSRKERSRKFGLSLSLIDDIIARRKWMDVE